MFKHLPIAVLAALVSACVTSPAGTPIIIYVTPPPAGTAASAEPTAGSTAVAPTGSEPAATSHPTSAPTAVDDTFTRSSTDDWGSAPTGGAYTLSGTAADFGVSDGVGSITMPTAGVTRSALLKDTSARDVDVSFRVRTDKAAVGDNLYIYGVVRRNGTNQYHVKLRLAPNGNVHVSASTVIDNAETLLGSEVRVTGLKHSPNTFIRFRAQVTGSGPTTLRVRAWADAAVEPTTWQYTATDTIAPLQGKGVLGLRAYVGSAISNAPVVISFDDYRVISPGTS